MTTKRESKRIPIEKALADYYRAKFAQDTGRQAEEFSGLWVSWDDQKRAYELRGEGLPAHPDLAAMYPNGWSLIGYITSTEAAELLEQTVKPERQPAKRILSVKVSREVDTDPDTSWLGEYGNTATSEYSIDRAHSEDCQLVSEGAKVAIRKLETAIDWIDKEKHDDTGSDWYPESIDDACDLLQEKIDELGECDCDERGDMGRGEYRYFNPSSNYDGEPAEDIRKYVRQDYERMESLNRQQWCFLGVRAEAKVQLNGLSTIQTINSGGLWGIESDSDDAYLREVEGEQLEELKSELHAIGFSKRAIAAAFRKVERSFD